VGLRPREAAEDRARRNNAARADLPRPQQNVVRNAGGPTRGAPLPLLQRWWFWAALVGALWTFPLWKSLTAELPPRLPGEDGPTLELSLPDELGGTLTLSALRGRLLLVSALPLAEARARDEAWQRLARLRKRLRSLDPELDLVVLAQGGDAGDLVPWLQALHGARPGLHFGLDAGGAQMRRLCGQAGAPSAEFVLLDRHGRLRGAYGGETAELDRLAEQAGHLANWRAQDPEP